MKNAAPLIATALTLSGCAQSAHILSFDMDEHVCDGHGLHVRRAQDGEIYDFEVGALGVQLVQIGKIDVRRECALTRDLRY